MNDSYGAVHSQLANTVLSISDPSTKFFAGIALLGTAFFGWYLAYRMNSQPRVFRLKLAIIFFIPALLSTTYLGGWDFSHNYKLMIACAFIVILNQLYWRSVKDIITPLGFHQSGLSRCLDMIPDLIWMKDIDHRFIYTNRAVREKLLLCSAEEAFGKTGVELAEALRAKGMTYNFGEICACSDEIAIEKRKPSRFVESGTVDDKFMSLQVYKAQLLDSRGSVVGTIGLGRDLTYDCLDHDEIEQYMVTGDYEAAIEAFTRHKNRYKFEACGPKE